MTRALCPFSSLALGRTTAISVTVTSQCSENTRVSAWKLGRPFIFSFSPTVLKVHANKKHKNA